LTHPKILAWHPYDDNNTNSCLTIGWKNSYEMQLQQCKETKHDKGVLIKRICTKANSN